MFLCDIFSVPKNGNVRSPTNKKVKFLTRWCWFALFNIGQMFRGGKSLYFFVIYCSITNCGGVDKPAP